MLVSVYVDRDAATHWYAHCYSYENAFFGCKEWKRAATVDEVCQVMRTWLESVISGLPS